MRDELSELLCCPNCRKDLHLQVFVQEEDDVVEGLLVCSGCERTYPIDDGIPHMLPTALAESPEFSRKHRDAIARAGSQPSRREIRRFEKLHRRTAESFGYEWNKYKVTTPEEDLLTLCFLTGIDRALYRELDYADVFTHEPTQEEVAKLDTRFLHGKLVLEVGCGMGKYVRSVTDHGGTAVGLDLSHSLKRARREHGKRRNLHLVRGDILEHPFKEGVFDFAYSVGVLHHTPDCYRAFRNTTSLVREGGSLAVWLYPTERMTTTYAWLVHFVQDSLMRPVTSRLPHPVLFRLCRVLGRMTFLRDQAARSGRTRTAQFYALFAVGAHTDPEIAAFLNFDWYGPQYRSYHSEDELLRWYRDAHYRDVRILPQRTSAIARRAAPEEPLSEPPPPRVHANVEAPGEAPLVAGEPFVVGGWALEEVGRSVIVRVYLDGRLRRTIRCFDPRIDVKAAFPEIDHALYTGFHTTARVPRFAKGRLHLRVTFEIEDYSEPLLEIGRDLEVSGRNLIGQLSAPLAGLLPARTVRGLARNRLARRLTGRPPLPPTSAIPRDEYQRWLELWEEPPEPAASASGSPRLAVVAICDGANPESARVLLDSLCARAAALAGGVCAILAGPADGTVRDAAAAFQSRLPQARLIAAPDAGSLAGALERAREACPGDFLVFVRGAALAASALERIERAVEADPTADVVYGDHDTRNEAGERFDPSLKPGFSPELLLVDDYLGPVQAYRRSLLESLGTPQAAGAELYDLALRAAERTAGFVRIPHVLGHLLAGRGATQPGAPELEARRRSAQAALDRRAIAARVVPQEVAVRSRLAFEWPEHPSVAVVIPTRDHLDLLERCIATLERRTRYPNYQIVIVNDRSENPRTLAYLERSPHRVVASEGLDRFNFAALVNQGAREVQAHYLLLLNNDIEIIRGDWMHELVGYARMPGVGAVGAKLLYPDERIQHAGVVLGHEGLTGHYFQGDWNDDDGYAGLKQTARNVAAVTAACLLTRRELFLEVGGFDDKNLAVAWNDVDYCLRIATLGYRSVVNPRAVLVHHEGVSRGDDKDESEIRYMLAKWKALVEDDPYYHPAFCRTGASYRLCLDPAESVRHHYRRFH